MKEDAKPQGKVAVVGGGYWGKNLVRNFADLGVLAAICDRAPEVAQALAARHGVQVRELPEILTDPAIDAVVIATPAETHAALVREALLAGKHVFVEKPLALSLADAEALCHLAQSQGRILMVGHLMRYHPAFQALETLLREGHIGRPYYLASSRLNLGKIRTEENILWSFAPHDISMILSLVGAEPVAVSAVGHSYLNHPIADVTTTHLSFPGGQAAHIHVSWLHPFKEQKLIVVGEAGMAVFDDQRDWPDKLSLYPHRIGWSDGRPVPEKAEAIAVPVVPAEPLHAECRHFLDCIAEGKRPLTDGEEGLRVLRVLDAAQAALEGGKATVSLPPPLVSLPYFAHETAVVDLPSVIGARTKIWHFSHVLKDCHIGENCNIGQNVVIGPGVAIGARCKIQNNVSVYTGVTLEDGVFCGPSMVFTNVMNPRAEIERKHEYRPTLVRRGATIGANATIVCGHTIGRYAFIGAGAVVIHDVPDHALMVGNPARRLGWVCECGGRLSDGAWAHDVCPECGAAYDQVDGIVTRAGA